MKAVQYFTDEYLEQCKQMSTAEILEFLENFRILHAEKTEETKSQLISLKVPGSLLATFRTKARLHGVPYQTQIKMLMKEWLE